MSSCDSSYCIDSETEMRYQSDESTHSPIHSTPQSMVFDLFGLLEHIFSFLDDTELVAATAVDRRWKQTGRQDGLWKEIIRRIWQDKKGVNSDTSLIFWRSLFNKERVQNMKQDEVLCMLRHPLLQLKHLALQEEISRHPNGQVPREFLQRFLQMHMLDVMLEGGSDDEEAYQRRVFFSDLYYGSYASSIMDSHRSFMSQQELCTPFGFIMHFKFEREDAHDLTIERREVLQEYDEMEGIMLCRHSTCYFRQDRGVRLITRQGILPMYRPTDLRWRWIVLGKQIQVGPYPSLTVSRTKDWGWKLENMHVLMYSEHGPWPPPQLAFHDEDDVEVNDDWSSDSSHSSGTR